MASYSWLSCLAESGSVVPWGMANACVGVVIFTLLLLLSAFFRVVDVSPQDLVLVATDPVVQLSGRWNYFGGGATLSCSDRRVCWVIVQGEAGELTPRLGW